MTVIDHEPMKRCSKCRQEQPRESFSPHKHTADRLASWCHTCKRDGMRSKRASIRAAKP